MVKSIDKLYLNFKIQIHLISFKTRTREEKICD